VQVKYVFAALAGIWLADGVALLVAPRPIVTRLRELLAATPSLVRWEGLAVCFGIVLLIGSEGLRYHPLWLAAGMDMIVKGLFLAVSPAAWREQVVDWCLQRDDVDYRFFGLALCTLSVLMLHELGWIGGE
jgi:uncharacterized protein YjeT (DUF2065 family)